MLRPSFVITEMVAAEHKHMHVGAAAAITCCLQTNAAGTIKSMPRQHNYSLSTRSASPVSAAAMSEALLGVGRCASISHGPLQHAQRCNVGTLLPYRCFFRLQSASPRTRVNRDVSIAT